MSEQTLRDTFAAAALSGLLGSGDINVDPSDNDRAAHVAELAYQWADAILRVRLHMLSAAAPSPPPTLTDAEREAVVAADSELSAIAHHRTPDKRECLRISTLLRGLLARHTDHDAAPAARAEVATGTGHTQSDTTWEPLCWCCSGPGIQSFHESKAEAEEYREHSGIADEVEVFQVGRAFALTDAERAFLQRERDLLDADDAGDSKDLGIINGLLARLGGGQ